MASKLTQLLSEGAAVQEQRTVEVENMANDTIALEGEVERLDSRPDDITAEVWDLMQENGELATQRLNEILTSTRFLRLRASDQAKLIALAQNRAYGSPKQNRDNENRRGGKLIDATASELGDLLRRASLPEYKRSAKIAYNSQPDNDSDDL